VKPLSNKEICEEAGRIVSTGETVELKITGGSMRPYLRSGKDIIVLSPFQKGDLKPGAIVLFCWEGRYMAHRIVKVDKELLIIQGDGSCYRYEEALTADVIGVVSRIIRPGGKTVFTDTFSSRIYWRCWFFLRPVRRWILGVYDLF
jgi:signal peptidase I